MTDNNRLMSVEKLTHKGKILHVYCMCMHGTDFIFISGTEKPSMRKPVCIR